MEMTSNANLLSSSMAMVAKGFIAVLPKIPIRIMVKKLSNKPTQLPKKMYIGIEVDESCHFQTKHKTQ